MDKVTDAVLDTHGWEVPSMNVYALIYLACKRVKIIAVAVHALFGVVLID